MKEKVGIQKMKDIEYLKPGDLIQILAPAKAIEKELVENAKDFFEKEGFKVEISENCVGQYFYFSGTPKERAEDFQKAIDNPNVKAIICARGGYGAIQIIDAIQWANQLLHPKWIVGFSDITVFHQKMQFLNQKSIHATMPLNFKENSTEALQTLVKALKGEKYTIEIPSNPNNKNGKAKGQLIGGNLSILYSLLGTDIQPNYNNKILFIEEVGEQLYAIDRMFYSLKKAGILDQINGLIVGGMTKISDTVDGTLGTTLEQIILSHFTYHNIPICFDFPAGHIDDNRALTFNEDVMLTVNNKVKLKFRHD